ncbi:MAG: hypothetical protein EPN45_00640 [Rhizobiaceae bacterium]|nr:MAG: hypothetical protein EPN45_00640 [Rhizobiaceae bacterium]
MNACITLFSAVGIAVLAGSSSARADMSFDQRQAASGLGKILAWEAPCGYKIDQSSLKNYYQKIGLSTPEAFDYVSTEETYDQEEHGNPSASDCTMAVTTARASGLLGK